MQRMVMMTALLSATALMGFENRTGWKKDDAGNLVLNDQGDPVFVGADGKELAVRGNTIPQIMGESRGYRERAERAEALVASFDGLDPAAAREALSKLEGVDLSKMIDAGKLDEVRNTVTQQFQGKLTAAEQRAADIQARLDNTIRSAAFASSEFIRERVSVPPEMFEATFGRNFKVEDGKMVPYGADGQVVYSSKNMGQVASLDEALEILVGDYKHKDSILKPIGNQGTGNQGGGGNRGGGGRRITRAELEAMPAAQQVEVAKAARAGEVNLTD